MFGHIVKFSCGCIGTLPKPGGKMIMFTHCDRDDYSDEIEPDFLDQENVRAANLLEKTWEPLTELEEMTLLNKMISLVYAGHRYNRLKMQLKEIMRD